MPQMLGTLTLDDLAKGKSIRRWCNECGGEFENMPVGRTIVYCCKPCWKKRNYNGPPPTRAAPHGPKAANVYDIWDEIPASKIVRRAGRGLERSNSDGMIRRRKSLPSDLGSFSSTDAQDFRGFACERVRRPSVSSNLSLASMDRRSASKEKFEDTSGRSPLSQSKDVRKSSKQPIPPPIEEDAASTIDDSSADRENHVLGKLTQKKFVANALQALIRHLLSLKLSHQELFERIDSNGDGQLSRSEMQYGLRKMGCSLEPRELDAVLRCFDSDGNGTIAFDEFSELLTKYSVENNIAVEPPYQKPGRHGGFDDGDVVRLLVVLNSGPKDQQKKGTVVGKGFKPDTVMVRFADTDEYISVKPNQLALVYDAARKEATRSWFEAQEAAGSPAAADADKLVRRRSVGKLNLRRTL